MVGSATAFSIALRHFKNWIIFYPSLSFRRYVLVEIKCFLYLENCSIRLTLLHRVRARLE